jgi:hypothetical protein
MELLTLDSNYQPAELVERYNSLLWTERYSQAGDFQLVTTDVERMLNLLPLESYVTLRESTVPMMVEVHKIEKSINNAPVLTITGRSFETVLERRAAVKMTYPRFYNGTSGPPRVTWFEDRDTPSDVAYQALYQMLIDNETMISNKDALPMVDLIVPVDYQDPPLNPVRQEVKPGNLYSIVMELLGWNHHGLKAVRPALGFNKIGIEIYNGGDLTNTVVFDAKFDQFESATYLLSETASTNWAYVFSKTNSAEIDKTQGSVDEPEGLERRVLYVDLSGEDGTEDPDVRNTRGLIELYKYNATALFDGQIGEQVAAGYNRDYFLGDIIRLDGEYGLSENVRVAEFIRSDDSTGSKAYPTFEIATS